MLRFFSGEMLTHRQCCMDNDDGVESVTIPFFNIACYGNQRLFHHLRKSFERKRKSYQCNK